MKRCASGASRRTSASAASEGARPPSTSSAGRSSTPNVKYFLRSDASAYPLSDQYADVGAKARARRSTRGGGTAAWKTAGAAWQPAGRGCSRRPAATAARAALDNRVRYPSLAASASAPEAGSCSHGQGCDDSIARALKVHWVLLRCIAPRGYRCKRRRRTLNIARRRTRRSAFRKRHRQALLQAAPLLRHGWVAAAAAATVRVRLVDHLCPPRHRRRRPPSARESVSLRSPTMVYLIFPSECNQYSEPLRVQSIRSPSCPPCKGVQSTRRSQHSLRPRGRGRCTLTCRRAQ